MLALDKSSLQVAASGWKPAEKSWRGSELRAQEFCLFIFLQEKNTTSLRRNSFKTI